MNKKIITLLALSFFSAHMQGAEKLRHQQPERSSIVEYAGKKYNLTPLSKAQREEYQRILRGRNEAIKATKLKAFFNVLEEDFPDTVQRTKPVVKKSEKQLMQEKDDALRAQLFEEGLRDGMDADAAMRYAEKKLSARVRGAAAAEEMPTATGFDDFFEEEQEIRRPMAAAMIGPDGIPHPVPTAGTCPDHPYAACGCMAAEGKEENILEECPVCRGELLPEQAPDLTVTPCGHTFHNDCLKRATQTRNICPVCRTNLDHTTPSRFDNAEREKVARTRAENELRQRERTLIQARIDREQRERSQAAMKKAAYATGLCCVIGILLYKTLKK